MWFCRHHLTGGMLEQQQIGDEKSILSKFCCSARWWQQHHRQAGGDLYWSVVSFAVLFCLYPDKLFILETYFWHPSVLSPG